jgi:MFS family permease
LSILGVGALFMAFERLANGFEDFVGLALVPAAVFVLGLFVAVERRVSRPVLDLHLFQSRAYTCGSLAAMFYFVAAQSGYFLLPIYAQVVLGFSPLAAGVVLVPLSMALTAASQITGGLTTRYSARTLSTLGMICTCAAVLWMSTLGTATPAVQVALPLLLLGAGGGLFHPPNNSAVLSAAPPQSLGAANGFLTTARTFGQVIGASLAAEIIGQAVGSSMLGEHREVYVAAQASAFRVAATLGFVGLVLSALRGPAVHSRQPGISANLQMKSE